MTTTTADLAHPRAEPRRRSAAWTRLFATSDALAPALARVALGAVIFPHGAQKAFGWFGGGGPSQTVAFFTGMGVPAALAVLVMLTEVVGSVLLVVGLGARLAALGVAGVMIGAVALVHWENGFFMNWSGQQQGEGFEFHLLALALCGVVLLAGAGRWSLDRLVARKAR